MDAKEWLNCFMSCFSKAGDNESFVGGIPPPLMVEWIVGSPGIYQRYSHPDAGCAPQLSSIFPYCPPPPPPSFPPFSPISPHFPFPS